MLPLFFLFLLAQPGVVGAQGYPPGSQFADLSIGVAGLVIRPANIVWTDPKLPDGVRLPPRMDSTVMTLNVGRVTGSWYAIIGGFDLSGGGRSGIGYGNHSIHGGVRKWVRPGVWLEGTVGAAYTSVLIGEWDAANDTGKWGLGLGGAVGVDVLRFGGVRTVNVQVRAATSTAGPVRTYRVGVMLGFGLGPCRPGC